MKGKTRSRRLAMGKRVGIGKKTNSGQTFTIGIGISMSKLTTSGHTDKHKDGHRNRRRQNGDLRANLQLHHRNRHKREQNSDFRANLQA